ncbi:hypothetical protein TNCV_3904441 [Trichonephila clavipes]|nr:hypothetical protein TNCV_3904441 [Trichonephila clavipes]
MKIKIENFAANVESLRSTGIKNNLADQAYQQANYLLLQCCVHCCKNRHHSVHERGSTSIEADMLSRHTVSHHVSIQDICLTLMKLKRIKRIIIFADLNTMRQKISISVSKCHCSATVYKVSWITESRCLHISDLFTCRPERYIPLETGHWQHGLEWCRDHTSCTSHQFRRALFMEESHFSETSDSQCQGHGFIPVTSWK